MRASKAFGCFTIALFIVAESAAASLVPRTDDVAVSTYATGTRQKPAIASAGDGNFLVVWEERRSDQDVHVRGRKLDRDGALLGTEFQVDDGGTAYAQSPAIAATADGGFVVAWLSDARNGERPRLVARRLDADGAPADTEFQLNTFRTVGGDYYLSGPALAAAPADSNGGFVVVWSSGASYESDYSYGPTAEVFERRFFADDTPLGTEELVSDSEPPQAAATEFRPDIIAHSDRTFRVVWTQGSSDGFTSTFRTVARSLHPSGQPSGTEFPVGDEGEKGPRVTAREPAGFTVVWSTYGFVDYIPQFGADVVARTFDASNRPLTDAVTVSTPAVGLDPRGDPLRPHAGLNGVAAATSDSGEFVVAWTSGPYANLSPYYGGSSDGDESGIFARPFARSGIARGGERQVNARGEHSQLHPDLAFVDGETVAVVWEAEETGDFASDRIYARVLDLLARGCGDADEDGSNDATDALTVLRAAVAGSACTPCLCDANASGTVTAADALIVLRSATGAQATLACPACGDAGVRFTIDAGDATCWGTRVEIPADALPEGAANRCGVDPSVALLGCDASLTTDDGPLVFDARGCFLDPADLFSCNVTASEAAAMAQASAARCGCGCAEECPVEPLLCVPAGGNVACSAASGAAPGPVGAPATGVPSPRTTAFETVTATQVTVTSSTTCGTCCDYYDGVDILLESEATLTELLVRFESNRDLTCEEDVSCGSADASIGGPAFERITEDGHTVEVCISDADGFNGPGEVATCNVLTGFIPRGPVDVVRALGVDFVPISPAPSVVTADEAVR